MDCENIVNVTYPLTHISDVEPGGVPAEIRIITDHGCPNPARPGKLAFTYRVVSCDAEGECVTSEESLPVLFVPEAGVDLGLVVGIVFLLIAKRFGTRFK